VGVTARRRGAFLARLAAGALSVGLVAACGSSSKDATVATTVAPGGTVPGVTTTAAPPRAACDILSRDEVAADLGNPVNDPQAAGDTDCSWGTAVDGGTGLGLTIAKPGSGAAASAECSAQRNSLPGGLPRVPVAGVGTSAAWVLEELTTLKQGHLVACWGDSVVTVLLTGERDSAALQATATKVAQQVHGRL
jgi:hypothetical protein